MRATLTSHVHHQVEHDAIHRCTHTWWCPRDTRHKEATPCQSPTEAPPAFRCPQGAERLAGRGVGGQKQCSAASLSHTL
jgi:hypothetical protein